jgi:hypothetical protein
MLPLLLIACAPKEPLPAFRVPVEPPTPRSGVAWSTRTLAIRVPDGPGSWVSSDPNFECGDDLRGRVFIGYSIASSQPWPTTLPETVTCTRENVVITVAVHFTYPSPRPRYESTGELVVPVVEGAFHVTTVDLPRTDIVAATAPHAGCAVEEGRLRLTVTDQTNGHPFDCTLRLSDGTKLILPVVVVRYH